MAALLSSPFNISAFVVLKLDRDISDAIRHIALGFTTVHSTYRTDTMGIDFLKYTDCILESVYVNAMGNANGIDCSATCLMENETHRAAHLILAVQVLGFLAGAFGYVYHQRSKKCRW